MWVKSHENFNDFEAFFVIASSIWRQRNKRIFEGSIKDPKTIIESALVNQKLYSNCLSTITCNLSKVDCWKPPNPSYLKLKTNGAIFVDLQDAGIGAILQNCDREVIMAASLKERFIQHLKMIESLAILRSIQLCFYQGISHLIVESDCESIVLLLQDPTTSDSPLENIIQEIKLLMTQFEDCYIQFNHHQSNRVAHSLAKQAWHIPNIVM